VYCVLCTVYCVLCTVYCVLCTVYCVLLVYEVNVDLWCTMFALRFIQRASCRLVEVAAAAKCVETDPVLCTEMFAVFVGFADCTRHTSSGTRSL
jgi:hypothetical protein